MISLRFLAALTGLAIAVSAGERTYRTDNLERVFGKRPKTTAPARGDLDGGRSLVAFSAPLDGGLADTLAARGVKVAGLAHKDEDFFLYWMDFDGRDAAVLPVLQAAPHFLEVQPERLEDKVERRLLGGDSLEYVGRDGSFRATVTLRRKLDPEARRTLFRGVDSLGVDRLDSCLVHVVGHRAVLLKLAERKEVAHVGTRVRRPPINLPSRVLTKVDALQAGFVTVVHPPTTTWLTGVSHTGDGVRIGINEGIDPQHRDFLERAPDGTNKLRKGFAGEVWGPSDHGTHVASIAAGNGWNSHLSVDHPGTTLQWRGVAPKTLLATVGSMDVNNHSFVIDRNSYYTQGGARHDSLLSDHTTGLVLGGANHVSVFGAANNGINPERGPGRGYYSMLNTTKNGIKVGATHKSSPPIKADFSSMGPIRDGRVGPDVMAPGVGVVAARMGTQDYIAYSGTSMATPHVTGIVALMLQKYRDGVLKARCNSCTLEGWGMWNSSARAILVQTAQDMISESGADPGSPNPDFQSMGFNQTSIFGKGPDFATGYGLVDAQKAVIYVSPYRYREDVVDQNGRKIYTFSVPAGTARMRITLAWDDPPMLGANDAATAYAVKLVNDLDLQVVDLGGNRRHAPWTLSQVGLHDGTVREDGIEAITPDMIRARAARPGRDSVNNLEVVDVEAPPAGRWAIQVIGRSLAMDQNRTRSGINQDFSLSFDIETTPASSLHFPEGMNQQSLSGAEGAVFAIRPDGSLWSWGMNSSGQAGRQPPGYALFPGAVGVPAIQSVSSHLNGSLALARDGSLYSWGLNYGQLGDGTLISRTAPVRVCNSASQPCYANRYTVVAAGPEMSAAIKEDGTLWAWGNNYSGALGAPYPSQILYPKPLGADRDWAWVTAGNGWFLALKTDGSLWGWGDNSVGQLGLGGGTAYAYAPTRVGTATWKSVRAGNGHALGIRSDGSLWAWGQNGYYQAGPASGNVLTPARIGADSDWKAVAAGAEISLALKLDGTLHAWGGNSSGELGRGTNTMRESAPQAVCNVTGQPCSGVKFLAVTASAYAVFAYAADGSSWAWGNNSTGAFGDFTQTGSAYPKKVLFNPNAYVISRASVAGAVTRNLTAEGTMDWIHWGTDSPANRTTRAGQYPYLGSYTKVGAFTEGRVTNGFTTFSWTDGTSPRFSHSVAAGMSTSVAGTGFQFTAPAAATTRVVRVYVAVSNATGRMEAYLSDGSGNAYSDASLTSAGRLDGFYEFNYSSLAAANLVIKWTKTAGAGTVSLNAAVLK